MWPQGSYLPFRILSSLTAKRWSDYGAPRGLAETQCEKAWDTQKGLQGDELVMDVTVQPGGGQEDAWALGKPADRSVSTAAPTRRLDLLGRWSLLTLRVGNGEALL